MFSSNIPERIEANTIPVKPSASHTAYESVVEPFVAIGGALGAIPGLESQATRIKFKERLDAIEQDLSNPQIGIAQKGGNWISNMAGGAVATAPAFAAAGLAAEGVVGAGAFALEPLIARPVVNLLRTPIAKLSSSSLSNWLPQASIGRFAKGTVSYMAGYKAAVLPEHIMDNYDKLSDTYNLKKAGEATVNDNLGMLIGVIPFAAGHMIFKAFSIAKSVAAAQGTGADLARELVLAREQKQANLDKAITHAKTAVDQEKAQQDVTAAHMDIEQHNFSVLKYAADMGRIPKEYGDWYHDYIKDPDAHEYLAPLAHKVLNEEQIPFDRISGKVWQKLLEPEDIKNHNSAVADEIASNPDPEYEKFLSQYVIHNRLDQVKQQMTEQPALAGGSQGYVDYVNKKLLGKSETLKKLDDYLDKHMTTGMKKKMPMSQMRIFNHLKKKRLNPKEAPYSVPGRVAHKLELYNKFQNAIRAKKGKYSEEHIVKLKADAKGFKLLTPAEELESIRSRLIASPEKEYFRGVSDLDDDGVFFGHDVEFGQGFWFAESKEHAEFYGKNITKIKGNFKIFDVLKNKDKGLLKLYENVRKNIQNQLKIAKEKGGDKFSGLTHPSIIDSVYAFRNSLQEKGYEGIQRREGIFDDWGIRTTKSGEKRIAKVEIMFFNPPEELTNPLPARLIKGFQNKSSYHRLNDLAELYPQAQMLLKRLHDEHEYTKQEANALLLKKFLNFVDSSVAKLAKPENVVKYLKDRIEQQVPDLRTIEPAKIVAQRIDKNIESMKTGAKILETDDKVLTEQEIIAKKSKAQEAKSNFKESKDRLDQFKEKEVDLDKLIDCIEGIR